MPILLDDSTRSEICKWIQDFRNSLEAELGEAAAAAELFSMPSFWTQHLLVSDPTAVAKGRRYYLSPEEISAKYNGESAE